jgi:phage baseplate assembly protein W
MQKPLDWQKMTVRVALMLNEPRIEVVNVNISIEDYARILLVEI